MKVVHSYIHRNTASLHKENVLKHIENVYVYNAGLDFKYSIEDRYQVLNTIIIVITAQYDAVQYLEWVMMIDTIELHLARLEI